MEFFTVMEEVHLYHILSVSFGMLFPDFDGCKAFFFLSSVCLGYCLAEFLSCVYMCVCKTCGILWYICRRPSRLFTSPTCACCHSQMRRWLKLEKGRAMKRNGSLLGLTLLSPHKFPIPHSCTSSQRTLQLELISMMLETGK